MNHRLAIELLQADIDSRKAKLKDLTTPEYVAQFDQHKIDSLISRIEQEVAELQNTLGILKQ